MKLLIRQESPDSAGNGEKVKMVGGCSPGSWTGRPLLKSPSVAAFATRTCHQASPEWRSSHCATVLPSELTDRRADTEQNNCMKLYQKHQGYNMHTLMSALMMHHMRTSVKTLIFDSSVGNDAGSLSR